MTMSNLAESSNFLIPNGTIIVEFVIFLIVLFVIWRFVVPPIRDALATRHAMVQRTLDENNKAAEQFAAAERKHAEALADARTESTKIRNAARTEGQRALDEARQAASADVADIQRRGEAQLDQRREEIVGELRSHVGALSTSLASRVVGEDVTPAAGRVLAGGEGTSN